MTKSLMLVSQSNSGSTWFANCIKAAAPQLRSASIKEYFNPALHFRRERVLGQVFGSEMEITMPNLASKPFDNALELVLKETWDKSGYNFTKENYLAFKINSPALRARFHFIGLLGEVRDCFPSDRNRVRLWYESWFRSLALNEYFSPSANVWLSAHETSQERALIAWDIVNRETARALKTADAPIFTYRQLFGGDLENLFAKLGRYGIDARELAWQVKSTRQPRPFRFEHVDEWRQAYDTLQEFCDKFPNDEAKR